MIRWDWISPINPKSVLDYGSGIGWFRAFRPPGVEVYSYDIGQYPQTGVEMRTYDVVCFWDVLEHIPDFNIIEPIMRLANSVAISIPMRDGPLEGWKHFKPGEHLHYFTHETLNALMSRYGFNYVRSGTPECPPRTDIESFIYSRGVK